jgi:hypothetical protein
MKHVTQFVITLATFALLAVSGAHAQTVVSVYKQPLGVVGIGEYQFIPCANNGQGQWIYLFGPEAVHDIAILYSDGSRRVELFAQVDFKVTPLVTNNVPPPTNLTYKSKATITESWTIAPGQTSGTNAYRENFIIAAGSGISFHYHEILTTSWVVDPVTGQLNTTVYHGNIFLACN